MPKRRRYISTDISRDKLVNELARDYGEFAVLLYTWMIPHAEDDATLTGDPYELRMDVIPGLRDRTDEDVAAALRGMHDVGLLIWDGEQCWFPAEAFYKHQTYIADKRRVFDQPKRRKPPKNAAKRRTAAKSAKPAASLSHSHSLSHSPPTGVKDISATFDEFWAAYPRKRERAAALRCFRGLVAEGVDPQDLIASAKHLGAYVLQSGTDDRYVPYGSTFLGPKRKWEDFVAGVPEDQRRNSAVSQGQRNALEVLREIEEEEERGGTEGRSEVPGGSRNALEGHAAEDDDQGMGLAARAL